MTDGPGALLAGTDTLSGADTNPGGQLAYTGAGSEPQSIAELSSAGARTITLRGTGTGNFALRQRVLSATGVHETLVQSDITIGELQSFAVPDPTSLPAGVGDLPSLKPICPPNSTCVYPATRSGGCSAAGRPAL